MKSKKLRNDSLLQAAKEKIKFRKYRKWYYSAFVSLAAIVVFCTVYALILPAITMTTKEGNTAPEPISTTGNISDLPGLGIFPAKEQEDGKWVVYDTGNKNTANVKAVITLPEGTTVTENCYPFIRRINPGEAKYPTNTALSAAAGAYNDVQCYMVHWIELDEEAGTYNLETDMEITAGSNATIRLEYLKSDARLKGAAGERKLKIFSSQSDDGTKLVEISDAVKDVVLDKNDYKGFTFHVTQPCPYVFVSKRVEKGYVQHLTIESITDGSAPFDNTDTPGNDSSGSNKIVRSYDTIQYNLAVTFAARQNEVIEEKVKMYFELTLGKSATSARFDVSKMLWLGENYCIEYLDDRGDVVMIRAHDGKYYSPQRNEDGSVVRDGSGFALADTKSPVSFNAQLNGSQSGEDSYKVSAGGVTRQRMVGWTEIKADEGQSILNATKNFIAAVEVRNADNGEVFSPSFRMWLEGNEENYGSESTDDNGMKPAQIEFGNTVTADGTNAVTVSAGTNFNIQLKKNTDMSYKNWFDFSTGQAVAAGTRTELVRLASLEENHGRSNPAEFTENGQALSAEKQAEYANYRYGRITCYGITLQLYNNTDNNPDANRAAKGLKGMSLPVGDITFDLNFSSNAITGGQSFPGSDKEYTAILWDYNENVPANTSYSYQYADPGRGTVKTPNDGKGNGGRTLYWDGEERSPYAKGGAPSNYIAYHDGCYYGGDWAMTDEYGNRLTTLDALNQVASPSKVTGTGAGTTYHFSVSDYDFDFDNQHFPLRDAGNSGTMTGYDTYARCFSAGCVQVLSVFPMVQKESEAEIFLNTTVSNLRLNTRAGQELKASEDDSSKINHEINTKDNTKRDQIVLYAPGKLTKGSSFNGKYKGKEPNAVSEGYLGTEYWTTSYDCSAFAGDEIWLISYGMMSSGSDYRTKSMNLLQLFDSRALSVRGEPSVHQSWNAQFDKPGSASFLYAADPDYPEGYDTNKDGILAYMNTVREEDLVYSSSMPDADGFITVSGMRLKCIGVLMELRGCDLLGGKYQYMKIPVKVNGDDEKLVGKTVATVNTFRTWSYDLGEITWANGIWDGTKNTLDGYSPPQNVIIDDQYSGELANGRKSPPAYVKTEYQNGHQKPGTHAGGTLSGNSLLILSYRAHVNIAIDNKGDSGSISYNQGNGETVVDYRLKNIKTELSDLTGQVNMPPTTLTVTAVLDEGLEAGKAQRISVSGGTYRMRGYAVDADGNPTGDETDIAIGTDPNNPVRLAFRASDGNIYIIKVHAVLGANSQSVSFVIEDAPVGIELPDITFQANFSAAAALKENDKIKTSVYISGAGDNRAYDQTKGNTDNITVGVVLGGGSNLTKAVDVRYIELNGRIQYTVTYKNSGTAAIDKIYFYDLLPATGDIRGSALDGKVMLRSFNLTTDGVGSATPATVYYSTTEYVELYNKVKAFGGTMNGATVTGMNEQAVEDMLESGMNKDNKPLFEVLGTVTNGKFEYDPSLADDPQLNELMESVTGLYVKATELGGGQTITMTFAVKTNGNKAGNLYKNISNSWIAGSQTLPLTSNMVETQAISRRISGVVWYDWNLNGVRDTDIEKETLLQGVTATLFRKTGAGTYEICTADVTGEPIAPVTTGADGAYSFENLTAGDYIVAFSGEALKPYTSATVYQLNKSNDSITNDGAEISELQAQGIDRGRYAYFIRYSVGSESMLLHSIAEMGGVTLNNGAEAYDYQDLGLIIAGYELPATGGSGTILYTTGGLLLMALPIVYGYRKKRRSERRMK